jgi:hypothetical protein
MRLFLSVLVLLASSLLSYAEPPKVTFPPGNMVVNHGKATVEFLPDGSVKIASPLINIVIPGLAVPNPPDPVNPDIKPGPVKPVLDLIADQIGLRYGSSTEENKAEKTRTLSSLWFRAVSLVDTCQTLGDLNVQLKKLQTLGDNELAPIREFIRDQIAEQLGVNMVTPLDKPKARALFTRFATALEKAVS